MYCIIYQHYHTFATPHKNKTLVYDLSDVYFSNNESNKILFLLNIKKKSLCVIIEPQKYYTVIKYHLISKGYISF